MSAGTLAAVIGATVVAAACLAAVVALISRQRAEASRLVAEVRLIVEANPAHRVTAVGGATDLVAAVNALADRRETAQAEVARQVAAARTEIEIERNRLATLMSELATAVVVTTNDGRILLYNAAARSLLGDADIGLGRSIFTVIDRDLVDHVADRTRQDAASDVVATAVHGEQLLQVRVAPAHAPDGAPLGYLLLLEDLTDRIADEQRRDSSLRTLTEVTRAALGSIRAAIEAVGGYPDMTEDERSGFLAIIGDETQRLGSRIEQWVDEESPGSGSAWSRTEVAVADLLALTARSLERTTPLTVTVEPAPDLWVRVDTHAVARAVVHLAGRLRDRSSISSISLSARATGRQLQLDTRWVGGPESGEVEEWLGESTSGGPSVRELIDSHGGSAWAGHDASGSYLRIVLGSVGEAPRPKDPVVLSSDSRPEFYDFDLFDREDTPLADALLSDLSYTVFDTETTGLYPNAGDEIISIGAVRIVNGRLLRGEVFDRLIDPGRSVPAASSKFHGLTTDDVRGQPPLSEVLRDFERFARDTVLVGHNVGFDLQFLRLKEEQTGVRLTNPVLDTLLLDAVAHPDHEEHSLEAIATRLGVEVVDRHRAVADALVTGEVFLGLVKVLHAGGIRTLEDAVNAAQSTVHARLDRSMYGD